VSTLLDEVPGLRGRFAGPTLGSWPSPLERRRLFGREIWVKREDRSAPFYAGNKIRPIELVVAAALAAGKRRIWATGAYGSNHAVATVVHVPRHGLEAGAILWPQPATTTAQANLLATLSSGAHLRLLRSIAAFPAVALARAACHRADWVMPPGAATPLGALGHASAALELAAQLAAHGAPSPGAIVLPCGSTCTTAGLLVGVALVAHLGLGFTDGLPVIHAVRVTPWPITAPSSVVRLAVRTGRYLRELGGPDLGLEPRGVRRRLRIIGRYIGRGYGLSTRSGLDALAACAAGGTHLDTTYSAKAAAYLIDHLGTLPEPLVFWSTKSSLPLPSTDRAAVAEAPGHVQGWLRERGAG